ncbi:MAG: CRISPR-associated endonuclease Cas1, partial [Acidobacteria bacterium]|nr:CRISPR-associated endonuclease Cas1 [Acidobacteriota bacterium]
RKAGDRFLVDKDDEVLLDLPYHKLESVLLFGNIQVTTQALAELLEKGVNLSLFSRQGNYRGSLAPPRGRNIELRLAQFEAHRDAARSLSLAKSVVSSKIANGLAVLSRYRDFHSGGERPGVFLSPKPMKRFFTEYERWMLARPGGDAADEKDGPAPRACFRQELKSEVEALAGALRKREAFGPFRFDSPVPSEEACNTSSVTI